VLRVPSGTILELKKCHIYSSTGLLDAYEKVSPDTFLEALVLLDVINVFAVTGRKFMADKASL
jgi:hypothetical protein